MRNSAAVIDAFYRFVLPPYDVTMRNWHHKPQPPFIPDPDVRVPDDPSVPDVRVPDDPGVVIGSSDRIWYSTYITVLVHTLALLASAVLLT